MEEYTGPKTKVNAAGMIQPHVDYVKWLEDKIVSLTAQLAIKSTPKIVSPVSRYDYNDNIDWPENDYR